MGADEQRTSPADSVSTDVVLSVKHMETDKPQAAVESVPGTCDIILNIPDMRPG